MQKTNSTMQQAAEEMTALRRQAQEAAPAAVRTDGQEPSSLGVALDMPQSRQMQQPSLQPEVVSSDASIPAVDGTSTAQEGGGGCPYIGFSASSQFLDAQSLWDATMAYSIAEHFQQQQGACSSSGGMAAASSEDDTGQVERPGQPPARPLVVHVCGKFHSEGGFGIMEHLAEYAPTLRVLVVTFVPTWEPVVVEEDAFRTQQLGLFGNFVVLTDIKLPRSFEVQHPL